MAERSVIAYRYLGTFETRKKTYATLERLGDFATFEVPLEWLTDDIESGNLLSDRGRQTRRDLRRAGRRESRRRRQLRLGRAKL